MANETPDSGESRSRVEETIELVKKLCLAMTNVEMFTADHPLARKSVAAAYAWIAGILSRRKQPILLNVAGRSILLDGMPLEDRNPLVTKLASRLDSIHVNNIEFLPELTLPEFEGFYRILGKGAKYINENGGFLALISQAKVVNIRIREVSYVMVTDAQRVVSKDAKVVESTPADGAPAEDDLAGAGRLSEEFLKGEANLKKTEGLLRRLAPTPEMRRQFLLRVSELLLKTGMGPEDVQKLIERVGREAEAPSKPRVPRKPFTQAMFDGVSKRLKDLDLGVEKIREVAESLSGFVEEKARERAGEYRSQAEKLRSEVEKRTHVLETLPFGLVLWSSDGKAELVNAVARGFLKDAQPALSPALKQRLADGHFPLVDAPDLSEAVGLTDVDTAILLSAYKIITDPQGGICGVALVSGRADIGRLARAPL